VDKSYHGYDDKNLIISMNFYGHIKIK